MSDGMMYLFRILDNAAHVDEKVTFHVGVTEGALLHVGIH